MCGILVFIESIKSLSVHGQGLGNLEAASGDRSDTEVPDFDDFLSGIRHRGPDSCRTYKFNTEGGPTVCTAGSVLQLRGDTPVLSPLIHNNGDVLLWNGEIFGGHLAVPKGMNDSTVLLNELIGAQDDDIPSLMSQLQGPWAFAFWRADSKTLWFGKDPFGRRSLLAHLPRHGKDERFILTSVGPLDADHIVSGFVEVPPGLYKIGFESSDTGKFFNVSWPSSALDISMFCRLGIDRKNDYQTKSHRGEIEYAERRRESAMHEVLQALRQAVWQRCHSIDKVNSTDEAPPQNFIDLAARVMVLFSGGVDSTLIAALAHEALPISEPIDLVTICFGNGSSPDRTASIDAVHELQCRYPSRRWRLILIDKTMKDVEASRRHLVRLLAPSDTMMDQNLGAALWLAANAKGHLFDTDQPRSDSDRDREANGASPRLYQSAARVVLLGHGADELFGGYARHRTRYGKGGWIALAEELTLDFSRLWVRNLGRDDRLIADRGREARHPFLDEGVVSVALKHALPDLMDFSLPPGQGDKRVLRDCLRYLGLDRASKRVKRAMQFGTRLARAANVTYFGGTRQANARKAGTVKIQDTL